MGFFDLFKRKKKEEDWQREETDFEDIPLKRESVDIHNPQQRKTYVRSCCEQMKEATTEIEQSEIEYRLVTDYLTDMEEIERLPKADRADINAYARKIVSLKTEQKNSRSQVGGMTDRQFMAMERIRDEMPATLEKLRKDEDYRALVKQDLQKLEGEKVSYQFRRRELAAACANARSMAYITLFALFLTLAGLLVFQFVFEMDSSTGYLIAAGVAALALTFIFMRYNNAQSEKKRVERCLNQVISLQNTVKIRYVNITGVLEYTYTKYSINSSDELNYLWEKYLKEKAERAKLEETDEELDFQKREMLKRLRKLRIKVPDIWVHQVEALIDNKEMVEIRHGLIVQRQSLRKRIEYNESNRNVAKEEIRGIVTEFPRYGQEILEIVSEYE